MGPPILSSIFFHFLFTILPPPVVNNLNNFRVALPLFLCYIIPNETEIDC